MVELVDAPDSKSGGLRPLGVRVPLPALVLQWFSTFAVVDLAKKRPRLRVELGSRAARKVVGPDHFELDRLYGLTRQIIPVFARLNPSGLACASELAAGVLA